MIENIYVYIYIYYNLCIYHVCQLGGHAGMKDGPCHPNGREQCRKSKFNHFYKDMMQLQVLDQDTFKTPILHINYFFRHFLGSTLQLERTAWARLELEGYFYMDQIRFVSMLPAIIRNWSVDLPTLDTWTGLLSLLPAVLSLGFVQGIFLCQSWLTVSCFNLPGLSKTFGSMLWFWLWLPALLVLMTH